MDGETETVEAVVPVDAVDGETAEPAEEEVNAAEEVILENDIDAVAKEAPEEAPVEEEGPAEEEEVPAEEKETPAASEEPAPAAEEPVAELENGAAEPEEKVEEPPTKKSRRSSKGKADERRRSSSRLQNQATGQTLPIEITSDNLPKKGK